MNLENINQDINEEIQLAQQIEQIETLAKNFMTGEAISRYNTLKLAHKEKAIKVIANIAELVMSQQLKEKLNDQQFKEILKRMDVKKDFNIKRI